MGVLGVVAGAILGGIMNFIINKQNHAFQTEQNRIEKIEQTTIDFLLLMQKICTYNLAIGSNTTDRATIQKQGEEIMILNEQVKAKMQFYFEEDEYKLAMEICKLIDPKTKEEVEAFNRLRTEKIDLLINKVNTRIKRLALKS